MKAKTLAIIILLAVLALPPLTPPVHGGMAGGPITASVGATLRGVAPAVAPPLAKPDTLAMLEESPFGKPSFAPQPSPLARSVGEGLGVRTAQQSQNVELVGRIEGATLAVAVQGQYAYVGVGPRLVVLDVSEPSRPVEVGRTSLLPGVVRGVAVSGMYAYVADMDAGLRVIDVSDPSSPREVGSYDTPGYAIGIAVSGTYAYVADGYAGLRVIDVSNPSSPREVGFYDTPGDASGVAVSGMYAYVADGYAGLRVIDVSNPSSPREVGFYDTPGDASGVAVSGSYAYVADGRAGFVILRLLRDKVTGSVPPTGGTLSSTSGDTQFVFPAGAVTQTITLVYRHLWTDQDTGPLVGIGHTFEVTAVYSDTGQPAQLAPGQTYTVTVRYADAEKGPAIENTLALYYWDGSRWVKEPSSAVDTAANTITAHPNHLSLWAVLGETRRVYLPLVLRNYR